MDEIDPKAVDAYKLGYARGLAAGRKEAANIPPDSIMFPDGRVVRVPTLADGTPAMPGMDVWVNTEDEGVRADTLGIGCVTWNGHSTECLGLGNVYSTRAAAEAAKEAKTQ